MPRIEPGSDSKILVTGANGFIGMWVVRVLLERGYSVRAVVRSEEKGAYLKDYFKVHGNNLEVIVVQDITKEGAFDGAVKDVQGVEHVASPLTHENPDPDAYIIPAVKGTLGLLQSALNYGNNVKRIIYTSSVAAVFTPSITNREFTEEEWNEESLLVVEQEGINAIPMQKYRASKTLAERAAWDFYSKCKGKVGWDFVTICPPLVIGPLIHEVSYVDKLNDSMRTFYNNVFSNNLRTEQQVKVANSWIDVRDVAEAHARALEKESAGKERIIVSAGPFMWQEWLDVCSPGSGFADVEKVYGWRYTTTKGKKILEMKYRIMKETAEDVMKDFKVRGWI